MTGKIINDESQLMWQDSEWQKQAYAWIRAEAENNSIRLTGEIEQPHVYHWSTVMRVPSNEGMLFFKATALETMHEIALTQKLAEWYPDDMPELIAVDAAHGWMLMRDGGEQLRASISRKKGIPMTEVINLNEKFNLFSEQWHPKIAGELNDSYVKLARVQGEFVWHHHENEDELFFVVKGTLTIKLRDKDLTIREGEFAIIPKGVEHMPVADEEVWIMMLELKTTSNTGNVENERTAEAEWI